jgi:hypothetical protein
MENLYYFIPYYLYIYHLLIHVLVIILWENLVIRFIMIDMLMESGIFMAFSISFSVFSYFFCNYFIIYLLYVIIYLCFFEDFFDIDLKCLFFDTLVKLVIQIYSSHYLLILYFRITAFFYHIRNLSINVLIITVIWQLNKLNIIKLNSLYQMMILLKLKSVNLSKILSIKLYNSFKIKFIFNFT